MKLLGTLGDRLLGRFVPRADAAAACSISYCSSCYQGRRTYRCCYNSPPPVTCTGCIYTAAC